MAEFSPEPEPVRDRDYLLSQAARCRRIASAMLDKKLHKSLNELAETYESQAASLEGNTGN